MTFRIHSPLAAALVAAVLLLPITSLAQSSNASISGVVTDSSGAAIAGADLTLKSTDSAKISKANSGSNGLFSFPNLPNGGYELTVSAKGFKDYVQTGIVLHLNDSVNLPVTLQIGEASQTVEVNANASPLNFENAEVKGTITKREITALPLQVAGGQRSAASFVILLPGVVTGNSPSSTATARFNGGQERSDEATLDGITMEEGLLSQSGMTAIQADFPISPEAVGEISVLTSNYDVQYGATGSAVIVASTKEGTNELHGGGYWFQRNSFFNARPWGAIKTPRDLENDYGGYVGGPGKLPGLWTNFNKTYFFVNYEQYRSVGATTQPVLTVPTEKMRSGDFSEWPNPIYDPATTVVNANYNPSLPTGPNNLPYQRQQFMGCDGQHPNVICPSDPRLAASLAPQWMKYVPAPNRPGLANNYVSPNGLANSLNANTNQWDVRGDEYFGEKDHLFGTYHYRGTLPFTQSAFPAVIDTNNTRIPNYSHIVRVNYDHIFSPTLVNHFAWGYLDLRTAEYNASDCCVDQLPKIGGVYSDTHVPVVTFNNFSTYGGNADLLSTRPTYVSTDTLTWVKGKHTLHFGGEYRSLAYPTAQQPNASGTFNFTNANTGLIGLTSGNAMASFLLGYVGSATAGFYTLPEFYPKASAYGFFAGDTWKAAQKLSVTYGMRWDVFTPSVEADNQTSFFDPSGANPGAGGRPGRLAFAGSKWGAASYGADAPEKTYYKAFAPRIGLAYAVTPKTVVRTGYGIFFEQAYYPGWNGGIATDGFNEIAAFSSTLGGIQPAFLLQDGIPQNFTKPPFIDSSFLNGQNAPNYRPVDANRRPYTQQWNFTIEQQIGANVRVTAAYVGNKGTRLLSQINAVNALNPSLLAMGNQLNDEFKPGQTTLDGVSIPYAGWVQQMKGCAPTVAQALLPYPQYCGNIYGQNESLGNSTYHALQLSVEKRFSEGLYFLASYSFSKTLTDADYSQSTQGPTYAMSPFQQNRQKALSIQDTPNTFVLSSSYELPLGRGKRFAGSSGTFMDFLLGGWQLNGIVRANSGQPLAFRSSYCNVPSQFAARCVPSILPGADPYAQARGSFNSASPLFSAAAFQPVDSFNFYFGNGPRVSNLRGFGFFNLDFGITKNFKLTERFNIQIRGEAFNAFNNHSFLNSFVTDIQNPNFGSWNGNITAPRNLQVGAKVTF
ncbi:MAG TPA: carboxypeptidase regulatory-like domain-containing protein [Bryobacteraceae bacterium]|nr:carboxypeptidase regulatory-like domain-containing protein [Bryobacteraceae bacterium]